MEAFFRCLECKDSIYFCQKLRSAFSKLLLHNVRTQDADWIRLKTIKKIQKERAPMDLGKCKIHYNTSRTARLYRGGRECHEPFAQIEVTAWYDLKRNKHNKWKRGRLDFTVSYSIFNCPECGLNWPGNTFGYRPYSFLCSDCSECICGDGSFIVKRGVCRWYFQVCVLLRKKLGKDITSIIIGMCRS